MTDTELNEWLAREVMGWHRRGHQWVYDVEHMFYIDPVDPKYGVWNPLHDHNHMALVRAKMLEKAAGYEKAYYQPRWKISYTMQDLVEHVADHKDELQAEAEAIYKATTKERGDG